MKCFMVMEEGILSRNYAVFLSELKMGLVQTMMISNLSLYSRF